MNDLFSSALPWAFSALLPTLLATLLLAPRLRKVALALAPFAPLPALALALTAPPDAGAELPLLLTVQLGLIPVTQSFLLFTAGLWVLAGIYARAYSAGDQEGTAVRFWGAFLLTMTGNLGVLMARDIVSFYLFFTLMSFSAYALVIHERTPKARRAAGLYLTLVVIGEAFLLPALILIATAAGDLGLSAVPAAVAAAPQRDLIIALVLAGFGVKAGALPLHIWLPLAHPAAPTPASAVLSGTMIKTGLLGWLLFLPLGVTPHPGWGTFCIVAGVGAALYGVVVGVTQAHPKTILAYSSISQMGLMTVALGIALFAPIATEAARAAVVIYATHHALAKVGLFLGVGVAPRAHGRVQRFLVLTGLLLAALALAGAPLTSGAVAKGYLSVATGAITTTQPVPIEAFLQLSAVGTTLLMARFLVAVWPPRRGRAEAATPATPLSPGLWLPWLTTLLLVGVWVLALPDGLADLIYSLGAFSSLSPLLIGATVALFTWLLYRSEFLDSRPAIPEGDLVAPVSWLLSGLLGLWRAHLIPLWQGATAWLARLPRLGAYGVRLETTLARLEARLGWTVAGGLFLLLVTTLLVAQIR